MSTVVSKIIRDPLPAQRRKDDEEDGLHHVHEDGGLVLVVQVFLRQLFEEGAMSRTVPDLISRMVAIAVVRGNAPDAHHVAAIEPFQHSCSDGSRSLACLELPFLGGPCFLIESGVLELLGESSGHGSLPLDDAADLPV